MKIETYSKQVFIHGEAFDFFFLNRESLFRNLFIIYSLFEFGGLVAHCNGLNICFILSSNNIFISPNLILIYSCNPIQYLYIHIKMANIYQNV